MPIYGPDGSIVSSAELNREVAAAEYMGARSHAPTYPTDGLTATKMAQLLRQADYGDPSGYLEMAEEIEEKDPHYLGVLATRKRAVAQLPVTVAAASDDQAHQEHAQFITDWIETGVLQGAMFDIMDAVGKGFSVTEIMWETTPKRFWPKALVWRPQRWFAFDDTDQETVMMRQGSGKVPLADHKFLIQRIKAKSGLTIRSGIARIAVWGWMFKAFTQKDWAVFTQNYGQPMRVGRYDASASTADREVLWRAVSRIAGDCAAIIPKGMEIEFIGLNNTAKSAELYQERCDWLDRQMSKLVLGQTTTTEAQKGAGNELGKIHRQVQEDIETADALAVSSMLTRDLVPKIIAFNFGPQDEYPRINVGRPDELPLEEIVNAVDKLGDKGLEVDADEIRERMGLQKPIAGAPVVGGRKVATPMIAPGAPEEGTPPPAGSFAALAALAKRRRTIDSADMLEALADRTSRDAAGALAGLKAEIRKALEEAASLPDALARLQALNLSTEEFTAALTRGMALANLAAQAALLDELAANRDEP